MSTQVPVFNKEYQTLYGEGERLKVYQLANGYTFSSRKDIPVVAGNLKPDAVVISARDKQGRLLVIREKRPVTGGYVWALPAGMIDKDETPLSAAIREIKEETGLDVNLDYNTHVYTKTFVSPGWTDEIVAIVQCTVDGEISNENLQGDEDIQAYLMSPDDMLRADLFKSETPMSIWLAFSLM